MAQGLWAAEPIVGREAAAPYFRQQEPQQAYSSPTSHYMTLHIGKLLNTDAWKWGEKKKESDAGSLSLGVTYRVKEWHNSADMAIRIDFNEYDIDGEKPQKLSFLPMIIFPDAASGFPLYFGAGLGLGIFLKQLSGEGSLALDYQLVVGIRFFDIFENVGFLLESGIKNHIQLTDEAQVNSNFVTVGSVFTF